MKKLLLLLLVAWIAYAQADGLTVEPFAGGFSYGFSAEDEFMVVTFQTDTESGQCTVFAGEGDFEGEILLQHTFEASSLKVAVETLSGRTVFAEYTKTEPVGRDIPVRRLPEARAVSELKDIEITPQVAAARYQFRAPGYAELLLKYRSSTQKGSVVLYAGDDDWYEGVLSLPYTYDDSYVVLTIAKTNGVALYRETIHTAYAVPESAEQAAGRLSGVTVCIDPGHQETGKAVAEAKGPGLGGTKETVPGMARGTVTERLESIVALEIGFILRDALLAQGADVVMTRETQDVCISNIERAEIAAQAGADFFLRLHCNNRDDESAQGVGVYCPYGSDYARAIADKDGWQEMGEIMLSAMQSATGREKGKAVTTNRYVGNNWARMPSFLIEMGYMSNPEEDLLLSCEPYQRRLAEGMAQGIYDLAVYLGLIANETKQPLNTACMPGDIALPWVSALPSGDFVGCFPFFFGDNLL